MAPLKKQLSYCLLSWINQTISSKRQTNNEIRHHKKDGTQDADLGFSLQHFFFQGKKETLAKKCAWPVEANRRRNG